MNLERKIKLKNIEKRCEVKWNSLRNGKLLVKELEEIGQSGIKDPFDYEELDKIAIITLKLFSKKYIFIVEAMNGSRRLSDYDLEKLEESLDRLPEVAKILEDEARGYEAIGLNSAGFRKLKEIVEGENYKNAIISAIRMEKSLRNDKETNYSYSNRKENDEIKNQINNLEGNNNIDLEADKKKIQQEIEQLRLKLEGSSQSQQPSEKNKNNFPYELVTFLGIIIIILSLSIIFLLKKKKKITN